MRLLKAAIAGAAVIAATFGVYQAVNAAPADPGYLNAQPTAPEPFRAQPLAMPKLGCPGMPEEGNQVDGTATVSSDNKDKAVVHREPVSMIPKAVAHGPAYLREAAAKPVVIPFPGGEQIRLMSSTGYLIGVFNIIEDPTAGTYIASQSWCAK